jgi:hypothetical protein
MSRCTSAQLGHDPEGVREGVVVDLPTDGGSGQHPGVDPEDEGRAEPLDHHQARGGDLSAQPAD